MGHYLVKRVGIVMVLDLCTLSNNALCLYKIFMKIPQSISELFGGHEKFTKENNFIKNVRRVTVLIFCTLCDNT